MKLCVKWNESTNISWCIHEHIKPLKNRQKSLVGEKILFDHVCTNVMYVCIYNAWQHRRKRNTFGRYFQATHQEVVNVIFDDAPCRFLMLQTQCPPFLFSISTQHMLLLPFFLRMEDIAVYPFCILPPFTCLPPTTGGLLLEWGGRQFPYSITVTIQPVFLFLYIKYIYGDLILSSGTHAVSVSSLVLERYVD